jgi:hypothetical protein
MPSPRLPSISRRARAAAAVIAAVLAAALAPPAASAQAGCITTLPVRVTLPDGFFAAAYTKDIRVRMNSGSLRIRNVRADLFTFSGRRMGGSEERRAVRGFATLTLRLERDFAPMQVGGFTLVLSGEPNASRSCGPKQTTRVVKFRACRDTLPIAFPNPPGGNAADYEGYLSVPVRSRGPLIRDLTSSVYGFDGSLLGNGGALPALFGETTLDHALLRPLTPGRYTVIVEGLLDEQPRSCGRKRAEATLTFR